MAESARSQKGVRGVRSTGEGVQHNALEGRGLLWSSLHGGKREGMPETANNPFVKARQLRCQAMDVSQGRASAMRVGEGWHRRTDAPLKGLLSSARWRHACHIQKIIVKPYAGKPHVRFERGF